MRPVHKQHHVKHHVTRSHTHARTHTGLIAGPNGIQKDASIASYGSQFTSSAPAQQESVQITKTLFVERPHTITAGSCAWLVNTAAGSDGT